MTFPLVKLEQVDVAVGGEIILHDLQWQLRSGEHWAVLGGNGSGKSTFLKLVRGELWPAPGRGRRLFALDGEVQESAVGVAAAMPLVSAESQERCQRLDWARTVGQVVKSGLSGGDFYRGRLTLQQRAQVQAAVDLLGLQPWWGRDVRELSTGELRRTLLARALAPAPRVLVCDEICDGLDAASRATLLQALERIARAGTQLLLATHRVEELIPVLTHRLVLEEGRILEQGRLPARRRTEKVLDSGRPTVRVGRNSVEPSSAWFWWNRRTGPGWTGSRPTSASSSQRAPLITIERASVYLGRRRVLRQVTWQMRAGEHWAITGPNGSGKTTLLKLISGDLHPALGGRIQRFDFTPADTWWKMRRRIGCVSPELQSNYREPLTGAEVIATGYRSTIGFIQRPPEKQVRRAAALAAELGFGELAARKVLALSYGEFRKILLARALVHDPDLLIFDEPFDGLDAPARAAMAGVLGRIMARGTSLIVVTHHASDLPVWITHRARLEAGRIVEQGPL